MDAITKEVKYESLAEQEELDREKMEQNKARVQLEETKDKMECLKRLNRQSFQSGAMQIEKIELED